MSWHDIELAAEHEALRLWLAEEQARPRDGGMSAAGFLLRVLANAVTDLPRRVEPTDEDEGFDPMIEAGYRVWIMASSYAPSVCPKSERADLLQMRRISSFCLAKLGLMNVDTEKAIGVFEFVLGRCKSARCMGKRACILAYALCTTPEVKATLPSMEKIGELWGLGARNKRSAVSAATAKTVREMMEKTRRRGLHLQEVEMWYSKRAQTREKYRQAQIGNTNRANGHAEEEADEQIQAEASEMRQGIPVRAEYAGLRAEVLRAKMQELHEQAEMRRLAAL